MNGGGSISGRIAEKRNQQWAEIIGDERVLTNNRQIKISRHRVDNFLELHFFLPINTKLLLCKILGFYCVLPN